MKISIVLQIIILVIIFWILYYFQKTSHSEASFVKSKLDNREYLVQNLDNKEEAAYILSVIRKRIFILNDYLEKNIDKYPEYREYIQQLNKGVHNMVLQENAPGGKYTSYTVNKGDEIVLCLRSKNSKKLHDLNLLMYVVLHELAHVACPEIDHTALFKKIFIFFLNIAILLKIYKNTNYQSNPEEYCGLTISENLLNK